MTDAERIEIEEAARLLADALDDLAPFTREILIRCGADPNWFTEERIAELRRIAKILGGV